MRSNIFKNTAKFWLFLFLLDCLTSCKPTDPVQDQIAHLKNQNPEVRLYAAIELGKLGDVRAVEPLIAALSDQDMNVRESAIEALGNLGKAAVVPLIARLQDYDAGVRSGASDALVKVGEPAIEPLIACLKDNDADVRRRAAIALSKLGDVRAVAPLIACLKDNDADMRSGVSDALVKMGEPAIEPLIACLKDNDADVRGRASDALITLDELSVKPLIISLKDPDESFRESVFELLSELGDLHGTLLGHPLILPVLDEPLDAEMVHFWIDHKDRINLLSNWEMTKHVLLSDLQSGNQPKIEKALYTFVSLGNQEIIPQLISVLNAQNDRGIAEMYLNCGNDELNKAAHTWVSTHGYLILTLPSGNGDHASWGEW